MRRLVLGISAALIAAAASRGVAQSDDRALGDQAQTALRKAVEFYRTKVATEGAYHFAYAEDLSYGRSEMSDGPTRIEVQRDGTPIVAIAMSLGVAAGATREQLIGGLAALVVGAAMYLIRHLAHTRSAALSASARSRSE